MTKKQIIEILNRHASPEQAARLAEHILTGIRLTTQRVDATDIELGASRIGGSPDVPPGFDWPTKAGRPLQFLAQLQLADFAEFPGTGVLGTSGWLYFFYDASDQPWGFDPNDAGSWSVRFHDGPGELVRTEIPPTPADATPAQYDDLPTTFNVCSVKPTLDSTFPDVYDVDEMLGLGMSEDVLDEIGDGLDEGDAIHHQLLGKPRNIQGDMQLNCQLVSNGIYCGNSAGYEDPRAAQLEAGAADWHLLLQLDTDEDGAGWMWGDCGMLYFWIREEDLRRRVFDRVWTVLQCH